MAGVASPSGEIVFRPNAWRYARFRFATMLVVYLFALGLFQVAGWLSSGSEILPQLRLLDLIIAGAVLFSLDLFYSLRSLSRAELKVTRRGVSAFRSMLGTDTICWDELDWPRTQRRDLLDRLLGQRYIFAKDGQRIFWQQVAFEPADVHEILDAMARRIPQG